MGGVKMRSDFYKQKDFSYTEIGIVLEKVDVSKDKAKIFIPILFPELSSDKPYKIKERRPSTDNIVNYNSKHGVSSVTRTNYIELKIPRYIAKELEPIDSTIVNKGQKILITFVGGEINLPRVIGVFE